MKKYLILLCLITNASYAEEFVGSLIWVERTNQYQFNARVGFNQIKPFKLALINVDQVKMLQYHLGENMILTGEAATCGHDNILLVHRIKDDDVSNADSSGKGKNKSP